MSRMVLAFALGLAAPSRAAKPDAAFQDAARLYAQKNYSAALAGFRRAARAHPDSPAAVAEGLALLRLGRPARAQESFSAYARARRARDARVGPAMAAMAAASAPYVMFGDEPGKAEMLLEFSRAWAAGRPKTALAWEMEGYGALLSADRPTLAECALRLRSLEPGSALGPFFSGFAEVLAEDRAAARADFAQAIRLDPTFQPARAALAQLPAPRASVGHGGLIAGAAALCTLAAALLLRRRRAVH